MKKFFFLWLLLQIQIKGYGQVDTLKCSQGRMDLGFEIQGYPAGIIPTVTANFFIINQVALRIRLGGNFANRRDFSPYNDNENAKGFGASTGLVVYFPYKLGHFTAGATIDFWNMYTNWKDSLSSANPIMGKTYTLVFQPWVDVGYLFNIKNTRINLGTTLGFGKEINIITRGERVGEGWMNSITFTLNYTLKR